MQAEHDTRGFSEVPSPDEALAEQVRKQNRDQGIGPRGYYGTRSREVLLRGPEYENAARPAQPAAASSARLTAQQEESVHYHPVSAAPAGFHSAPPPQASYGYSQPMLSSRQGVMGPDGVMRYS